VRISFLGSTFSVEGEEGMEKTFIEEKDGRRGQGREEGRKGEGGREVLTGSACKRTRSAGATSAGALLPFAAAAGSVYVFDQEDT